MNMPKVEKIEVGMRKRKRKAFVQQTQGKG